MAHIENRSARDYLVGNVLIKPTATEAVPDSVVEPLLQKSYFKAWQKDLIVTLDSAEPETKRDLPELKGLDEEQAKALVSAEENPPTLRRWAKKERRESVLTAIESRLKELG